MEARIFIVLLWSLVLCCRAGPCSDERRNETLRSEMLSLFRSHFDDQKNGMFERPHVRQPGNQVVMLSKQDYKCGHNMVPAYFIEYVVDDVRPVDVFNVLADTLSQPNWLCKGCTISLLVNDEKEQVQGYAAAYRALPVNRREFYQWQAYDVDVANQEFLLGTAARHNDILHELKAPEDDATVGRMCYSFSRMRRDPKGGTRVTQMSLFDARVPFNFGPFTPRNMYHLVWRLFLQRVPKIMAQAKLQASLNLEADKIFLPETVVKLPANFANGTHKFSARMQARRSDGSADAFTEDELMAKRIPWLVAAFVAVVAWVTCGLCVFCGACSCCGPQRKGAGMGGLWSPLETEGTNDMDVDSVDSADILSSPMDSRGNSVIVAP